MKKIVILIFIFMFASVVCFGAQSVDIESLQRSHVTTVVTVGVAITALPATPLAGRKAVMIQNISTSIVYVGNSAVTADEAATGGYQLAAKYDSVTLDFTDDIIVYGRVAAGTAKVVVFEAR